MGQSRKRILVDVDLHGPVDLALCTVLACRVAPDHDLLPGQIRPCFTKLGPGDYRMRQSCAIDIANPLVEGLVLTDEK